MIPIFQNWNITLDGALAHKKKPNCMALSSGLKAFLGSTNLGWVKQKYSLQ